MTSKQFSTEEHKLKTRVIKALRSKLSNKKREIERFVDEANNDLTAIDKNGVWFDDGSETYPLSELGLRDAIDLLSIVE